MAVMNNTSDIDKGFAVEPVVRPRQQVEAQLRSAVLSGVFKRGDRLPSETRLAEDFKVSRTTIREALRALAEAGLISKVPGANGGSFVTYFDHHMLAAMVTEQLSNTLELGSISYDEVGTFRNILEVPTARLAAVHCTDEHLRQLDEIIEMEKVASVTDPSIPAYNESFHRIIADASGNRLISAFVAALHRATHPLTYIDTSPELGRQAVRHHIEIAAALARHDPDQAAECMERHLAYLREHVVTAPPDRQPDDQRSTIEVLAAGPH